MKIKKTWVAISKVVLASILLCVCCKLASNRRLVNKLNPVWVVEGHVLSERGTPISDVELKVFYGIGFYPIGRILEQSDDLDQDVLKPDTNGFFSIRKRCSDVIIRVEDSRYEIVAPPHEAPDIIFAKELPARDNPLIHNSSDTNLKVVLKTTTNSTSAATATHRSP